jgi:hypothetical protein
VSAQYTDQAFEIGCKRYDMKESKLQAVTTLALGEEATTLALGEEVTTQALGEEHPSTLPLGEEDAALPYGAESKRSGPFGAY